MISTTLTNCKIPLQGELVRIVLCDLNDAEEEKLIFREHEKALELLSVPGSFTTRMVSDVERLFFNQF